MTEHREAQDRLGDKIIETFGGQADPVEREKLIGAVSLGQRIADFLQSEVADDGTWVDTGSDGGGYEAFVKVSGREFQVYVSPGSTDAEIDQWQADLKEEASQWDLLCPRVIEALRQADPALADEFEAYVTPPRDSGSDRNGEDSEAG